VGELNVVADMACRHTPKDVYGLWAERREGCVLLGWETAAGGNRVFCLDGNGELHPVAVPWSADEAARRWREVMCDGVTLRAEHGLGIGGDPACFGVRIELGEETADLAEDGASLLFPCVCLSDGEPLVAMIRTVDVENEDGVIDQHNSIVVARRHDDGWRLEQVADLKYGLLPKAGVWGYPGKRRRPYLLADDAGGAWLLWERKEPHDQSTRISAGALLGRRFADGAWSEPVRIIEGGYYDYAPAAHGIRDGRLMLAAQKGVPFPQPGRGEVVLLEVQLADCAPQPEDTGWEGWRVVNLAERQYDEPESRELELDGEQFHLVFGDPHTHSGLSEDAEGDLIEMLAYARDKAKLDFVAITDNDYIYGGRLSDRGWQQTMREGRAWSEDGRFIAVPAYEWTQAKWGPTRPQHRSILFRSYDQPMLRWKDAGIGQADDAFDALVSWVESTDAIMNTQHAQFMLSGSEREANMEVVCGWGDYINKSDCFHEHLNRGFRVGFVGTSDGHRRTPGLGGGLTGLWVRELTLDAIIDAFATNRCYATAGARIGVRFWVNDTFMGGTIEATDSFTVRLAVDAPRKVETVEIVGDGEVVATLRDLPAQFDETIEGLPACGWYYAKVTMPGGFPEYPSNIAPAEGPWAWSSPVFVR